MLDLNELQRLAEEAGSRLPGEEWFDEYELRSILMAHEQDARLIAAMSPDTAKKLIAVARAAQAFNAKLPLTASEVAYNCAHPEQVAALRTALEELKHG